MFTNTSNQPGDRFDFGLPTDGLLGAVHIGTEVDLVFTSNTYHHFDYPDQMLAKIRNGLRPGGRLAIVDYYKESFRDPDDIRIDKADVVKEIEAIGFRLMANTDHIEGSQYLIIFDRQ